MPQWYMNAPGVFARKRKWIDLPFGTGRLNVDVRRNIRCVEVDRVRNRATVDEFDIDHVALADMDHRTGCRCR